MNIETLHTVLAQAFIAFGPIGIILLLPQNKGFFEKKSIRSIGVGLYIALIFILLKESAEASVSLTLSWYVIGLVVSVLIGIFLPHHHHTETGHHSHNKKDIVRILGSDFLHNIVDGIVILSGFLISTNAGLIATLGVFLHQALQQVGQQVLLVDYGITPKKAIGWSLLIALSIFIGNFFVISQTTQNLLMAVSAGMITITILEDLKNSKTKKDILWMGFGFALMWAIVSLVPHVHHDDHDILHDVHEDHSHME